MGDFKINIQNFTLVDKIKTVKNMAYMHICISALLETRAGQTGLGGAGPPTVDTEAGVLRPKLVNLIVTW